MILREMSMQINHLVRQKVPISRIAARLGLSRQTIYNHLRREPGEAFPKPRPPRSSVLDPYKAHIRARLESFDLPATVLLQEIRALGYRGKLTILREFIRPLRQELIRRVTERFETLPGRQAQIDWGECGTIEVAGEKRKLYVFVLVLGYSRMMYAHFTTSSKLPVLLRCLARAFEVLGVPAELLVDNMKQAVDQHDVTTGTVRWNKQFLDFVDHYSVLPVASPPYWPRVKGKVERGVGYIKTSFLEGRSFTDLEDLNRQLASWLDQVANVRIHGTTGERPVDRHVRELVTLRPYAAVPRYDTRSLEIRRVAPDCHISYCGVFYSVDPVAAGHTVTVRAEGEGVGSVFSVYHGERLVGRHVQRPKGTPRVTLPEHLAAIRKITRRNPEKRSTPPGGQPKYHQQVAPEVQQRSLREYEVAA
jgi:transposase